ncbi:Relaxase/Mobilization nuclease domain protein [Botrimarina colliarenosi]|uniref:Relaxase/Mobilization nuclease domain protein n=1 Tax=Botrimarina colliarenosi TaxID=2528001 RepID=A0A5C6A8R6_9BACT|nr:relaxase/mobilization nuclease domain-containing protein [Botrimarina colliarenosi]TWT95411.1 Relaxase/Mobilization nuclease domain protein [Botrimarina colliarenosi]
MVPKIHPKRQNFRSTASYLLKGRDASHAGRVAWTSTRNLATHDPDMAWRVMAATSMDQARLKAQAGVPNTGRKSLDHVLHFTLSWHPEEAAKLDKREMLRAAHTVLRVMGAQEHQSLVVAHNDRPQPHVHVMVNRVHPRDGRMLSSSFEKLKASRWAEEYERQRGKIYCQERVLNNEARDRGEYVRGSKDEPRAVHEAAQAANDNTKREAIRAEHRRKAALLKDAQRRLEARHKAAWAKHQETAAASRRKIAQAAWQALAKRVTATREAYRPKWRELRHEQQVAREAFGARETRLVGRISNALRSVDLAALMRGPDTEGKRRLSAFGEAFQFLADAGARREALEKKLGSERRELLGRQREEERRLKERVRAARRAAELNERRRLDAERNDLVLTQSLEKARLRGLWVEKARLLRDELRGLRAEKAREVPAPAPALQTKPAELVPQRGAKRAAGWIDGWREIERERLEKRRERDDGVDR